MVDGETNEWEARQTRAKNSVAAFSFRGRIGSLRTNPNLIPAEPTRAFLRVILDNLFRIKVRGQENLPIKGGAVLVCNYTDYLDIFVQAAYSPRKLIFPTQKGSRDFTNQFQKFLFQKGSLLDFPSLSFLKPFLSQNLDLFSCWLESQSAEWGALSASQAGKARTKASLDDDPDLEKKICTLLAKGNVISIFPENEGTRTGTAGLFNSMAAKLAVQAQVPILPACISGTWKLSTAESLLSGQGFQRSIGYSIGKAVSPENFPCRETNQDENKAAEILTAVLEKEVQILIQETDKLLEK